MQIFVLFFSDRSKFSLFFGDAINWVQHRLVHVRKFPNGIINSQQEDKHVIGIFVDSRGVLF
jgi:hypothetical protein